MSALVLCSLTIIVTLLWSGIAKALDRTSTAQAIVNLRLEKWIPLRVASLTVPWLEIALGLGLLLVPGMLGSLFGVMALVLFIFYWGVIMRAIIEGNQATCNCFGSKSAAPVSFFTLFRNTGLLLAAVGAFGSTLLNRASALGVLIGLDAEGWLWFFGAAIIAFVLWSIYRSENVTRSSVPALHRPVPDHFSATYENDANLVEGYAYANEVGDAQPEIIDETPSKGTKEFRGESQMAEESEEESYQRMPIPNGFVTTVEGHRYSLRQLSAMKARVLFHVSPTCNPCLKIIQQMPTWQEKLPMLEINPVVDSENYASMLKLPDTFEILVDNDLMMGKHFGQGTPSAVALGADGLLAGGPVLGSTHVEEFMNDIMYEMGVLEEDPQHH